MNSNKKTRVVKTSRTKRKVRRYASSEERTKGIYEKNTRYYAKYKEIAKRKQNIRHAKKKLLAFFASNKNFSPARTREYEKKIK